MSSLGKWIEKLYPMVLGITITYGFYWFKIDYSIPNFEKVLDNASVFSSIVVGFLGALLGILVSIKNSEIVDLIFKSNEKNTLKYYFNETFLIGFLVVILSSVMQVMRDYKDIAALITYYVWLFSVSWFIPSTYRIVSILMRVFFKSNTQDTNARPQDDGMDMNASERKGIKDRLKKKK